MRTSHVAGLVFLTVAALAQRQQPVEMTSESCHHLVLGNKGWASAGVTHTLINSRSRSARFVALEFKAEKQNP